MSIKATATARLTADPELRFTQAGRAIASLRVASNDRRFNRDTNEWEDGDSTFIDVTVFGAKAEAAAETLRKGQLTLIAGTLKSRQYENRPESHRLRNPGRRDSAPRHRPARPTKRPATPHQSSGRRPVGTGQHQRSPLLMRPPLMTADELLTEVEHLTRHGVPADEIARRLGRKLDSMATAMYRAGRRDLGKQFYEESNWRSKRRAPARPAPIHHQPHDNERAEDGLVQNR